jgi:ribosomal protein S1
MQGVVSAREFDEDAPPKVGDAHSFTLHGKEDDLWLLSRREAQSIAAWNELEAGALVKARVSGQNTGGLELKIGKHDAFMPASQVSMGREEDLSKFMGQTLVCQVLEIDKNRKRVVLSRRKVLEKELSEARGEVAGRLSPGATISGTISRVESFGAFVDIGGGLEGLVHVSNMSRKRVEKPDEFVKKGQQVQVMVLEIKEGGKRVGLGMKQLEPDPWVDIEQRLGIDSVVAGSVTRVVDFGAFVEIEPGVEGLLHVSQLGKDRVRRAADVIKVGEEVSVRIVDIDVSAGRLSLSRLDSRGAVIGSEESVDASTIDQALASSSGGISTNLGDLFKKAMGDKKKD